MRSFQMSALAVLLCGVAALVTSSSTARADSPMAGSSFAPQHRHPTSMPSHWDNQSWQHRHPLRMQQVFVVTERNPLTGDLVGSPRRFTSRLEATEYRESLRSGAWVIWRYVGIGEPLRSLRFSTRFEAEKFVRTGGPARRGFLGALLVTHETRILPARVSLDIENVR